MDTLKSQIEGLSPEDWDRPLAWVVGPERQRREALPLVEAGQAEVVEQLVTSGTVTGPAHITLDAYLAGETPPAWVNPLTIHIDMYRQGMVVASAGRVWFSEHPGLNHWEPGAFGVDSRIWRDVTDLRDAPAPVDPPEQPGDEPPAGDAPPYAEGVEYLPGSRFTYRGLTYEVLQAHTSAAHWPPDQAPSLYKAVV